MKLEQQVCSLELAKRLQELGVKQESLLWHFATIVHDHGAKKQLWKIIHPNPSMFTAPNEKYSAFTVAELGEIIEQVDVRCFYSGLASLWLSTLYKNGEPQHQEAAENEADSRAKILIYLLENELIQK